MKPSSFEHIVRIQFNALMMTVIKCTVKSRNRQFVRRSKREILFCELSDTKLSERGTIDNYSCDCISFKVLNYTIQVSNEKFAVALYKLSSKERDVILLRYFQSMSDQEIAELYHVSRSAIYRIEPAWVTSNQIEAARIAMTRYIKRGGQVWIKIFPDKPITEKPAETRMGSGKGSPEYWVAVVKPGRVMFEIGGVPEDLAREAMRLAAHKLPIKCKFVAKETEEKGSEE